MEDPDLAVALSYDRRQRRCARASWPRAAARSPRRSWRSPRDHGVAVRRDQDLAALLGALEIDCPIPVAAFAAVAEILAQLYRANRAASGCRR